MDTNPSNYLPFLRWKDNGYVMLNDFCGADDDERLDAALAFYNHMKIQKKIIGVYAGRGVKLLRSHQLPDGFQIQGGIIDDIAARSGRRTKTWTHYGFIWLDDFDGDNDDEKLFEACDFLKVLKNNSINGYAVTLRVCVNRPVVFNVPHFWPQGLILGPSEFTYSN
jgi:hypothetical protein